MRKLPAPEQALGADAPQQLSHLRLVAVLELVQEVLEDFSLAKVIEGGGVVDRDPAPEGLDHRVDRIVFEVGGR